MIQLKERKRKFLDQMMMSRKILEIIVEVMYFLKLFLHG
jgi:hypothetical protein